MQLDDKNKEHQKTQQKQAGSHFQLVEKTNPESALNVNIQTIEIQEKKQCRICLMPQSEQQAVLAPCKCKGTVQYCHTKCLREWLNKLVSKKDKVQNIKDNHYKSACQMCQQQIQFQVQNSLQVRSCERIRDHLSRHKNFYIFYFLIGFAIIGLLIFLSYWYSIKGSYNQQDNNNQPWMWIVILIVIVVLCLMLLKVIVDIIRWLFLSWKRQVTKIVDKETISIRKQNF